MTMEQQIENTRKLEIKKNKLMEELANINKSIDFQIESCSPHLLVDLGYYGPSTGRKCRCLICGKWEEQYFFYRPEDIIYAENYLPEYNIMNDEQCNAKFANIQALALSLLREEPNMSKEELANQLENLIHELNMSSSSKSL